MLVNVHFIIWLKARLQPNVAFALERAWTFEYNSAESELIWITSGARTRNKETSVCLCRIPHKLCIITFYVHAAYDPVAWSLNLSH